MAGRRVTEIGGRLPVNTDGGCLANGEPVGASGLRQVHEICVQLRVMAVHDRYRTSPKSATPTSTVHRASVA